MTNLTETLAALSEAATQGEWVADGRDIRLIDSRAGWGVEERSNVAFIAALVNAFRTGQLIARPDRDAAIERMARALAKLHDDLESLNAWRVVATAAYDAMFDGPAPTGNPLS